MKAYMATWMDDDGYSEEWSILVHGETPEKAKARALRCEPTVTWDYRGIRLTRRPQVDNVVFTYESTKGLFVIDSDEEFPEYINFCDCEICRPRKHGEVNEPDKCQPTSTGANLKQAIIERDAAAER